MIRCRTFYCQLKMYIYIIYIYILLIINRMVRRRRRIQIISIPSRVQYSCPKDFYIILIIIIIYIYILYIHHLVYIPTNVGCDFSPIVVLVPPIRTGCISGVRGESSAPGLSPCAAFRTRSVHMNRVRPLST